MDNTDLAYVQCEAEQEGPFIIDSDVKAEWALKIIADERSDTQRLVNISQTMILEYQQKIEKYNKQLESNTGYLKSMLMEYFSTVKHKEFKTQETYKLPSGTLKMKKPSTEFVCDDKALVKWMKENNPDLIQTVEKPKWAELKKNITVTNGTIVDENGVIVEGVKVEEKPAEFSVEV